MFTFKAAIAAQDSFSNGCAMHCGMGVLVFFGKSENQRADLVVLAKKMQNSFENGVFWRVDG